MPHSIAIISDQDLPDSIMAFLRQAQISLCSPSPEERFVLDYDGGRLYLCERQDGARVPAVAVDFVKGRVFHRLRFGQGKEAVARAVGVKKGARPSVLDATAGLGRDAFILASFGCRVHMIERSPVVAALLCDGLRRAGDDPGIGIWVKERLSMDFRDGCDLAGGLPFEPDVVYLDPMFPRRRKSALVKKEMRVLQDLLGPDGDTERLLEAALHTARERVVVKRPVQAEPLAGRQADACVSKAQHRFDIYFSRPEGV